MSNRISSEAEIGEGEKGTQKRLRFSQSSVNPSPATLELDFDIMQSNFYSFDKKDDCSREREIEKGEEKNMLLYHQ